MARNPRQLREIYVGMPDGVIKVRTTRRKGVEADRWNVELMQSINGTPWEFVPGREGVEVVSRLVLPRVPREVPPMIDAPTEELEWRRQRKF